MVVKLLIGRVVYLRFRSRPNRRRLVQPLTNRRVLATSNLGQRNRKGDMIRVCLDDVTDSRRVEILLSVLLQLQDNLRAAVGIGRRLDREFTEAVGTPAPSGIVSRLAGRYGHFVRHHKGGIEPNAKLADQIDVAALAGSIFFLAAGHRIKKRRRTRSRDSAQIFNEVLLIEADAVISNRQGLCFLVELEIDPIRAIARRQCFVGERCVAELVARIRRIGNQLAQKNLLFAIKRIGDDVQQAADFCLKLMAFTTANDFVRRGFLFCFGHDEIPEAK